MSTFILEINMAMWRSRNCLAHLRVAKSFLELRNCIWSPPQRSLRVICRRNLDSLTNARLDHRRGVLASSNGLGDRKTHGCDGSQAMRQVNSSANANALAPSGLVDGARRAWPRTAQQTNSKSWDRRPAQLVLECDASNHWEGSRKSHFGTVIFILGKKSTLAPLRKKVHKTSLHSAAQGAGPHEYSPHPPPRSPSHWPPAGSLSLSLSLFLSLSPSLPFNVACVAKA